MTGGVYEIVCIATGERYVGSTIDLHRREVEHWKALRLSRHKCERLQSLHDMHGMSAFVFAVLMRSDDQDERAKAEERFIAAYGTTVLNTRRDARSVSMHTDAERERISRSTRRAAANARKDGTPCA